MLTSIRPRSIARENAENAENAEKRPTPNADAPLFLELLFPLGDKARE